MGGEWDKKQPPRAPNVMRKQPTHSTNVEKPNQEMTPETTHILTQEDAGIHDRNQLPNRRWCDLIAVLSIAVVVVPIVAIFFTPRIVCATSTKETTLAWIQGLPKGKSETYYLNPILNHFEDFTLWDKFMLGCRCKELVVVELAHDFVARNALENYQLTREYVRKPTTLIAILNGTCESFAAALNYGTKAPTDLYDQCLKNRPTVFSIFIEQKLSERLIGKEKYVNSGVIDIPCLDSSEIYAAILFLGGSARMGELENVHAQLARKAKQHEAELANNAEVEKKIQNLFSEKRSVLCRSSPISGSLDSFKFAVIGLYASGKSTTLQWLSTVAGLEAGVVKTFSHAGNDFSFTRDFAPVTFSKYVTIADTQGFISFNPCFVSDVRKILYGRNRPYQRMEYAGCNDKNTHAYLPSTEMSQILSGLLFTIKYTPEKREQEHIKTFVKELKYKYDEDLTRSIVFVVTHLRDPHIIIPFANQIGVSPLDIFPLINNGTQGNVTLTSQSLYPPLKRIMEKACLFHHNQMKQGKGTSGVDPDYKPGLFSWFF